MHRKEQCSKDICNNLTKANCLTTLSSLLSHIFFLVFYKRPIVVSKSFFFFFGRTSIYFLDLSHSTGAFQVGQIFYKRPSLNIYILQIQRTQTARWFSPRRQLTQQSYNHIYPTWMESLLTVGRR